MCLLNWFHLLDLWATGPFQSKISCSSEPESLFILIRVCSSFSLSLCFSFFLWLPLCPSLYLALCSSKKVCSSLQRTTWCFWQKVSNREETRCTLKNVILTLPYHVLKTHTCTHTCTHTHTHTQWHTHTHECTHVHTHSSYFLHTLSHTQTLLHTHLWGHFTDLLHCLNLKPLDDWTFALVQQSNREKWLNRRTKKTTNFVHFCSFVWVFFSKQRNLWSYRIGLK